jgi:WD40 repeat protein
MQEWHGHEGGVHSLVASQDGKLIACGCGSGAVRVWDVYSGAEHITFTGHKSVVEALAFSPPDGRLLATGSQEGKVRLVDTYKLEEVGILHGHDNSWIRHLSFSSDGQLLLSGDFDRMIVWDVKTHRKLSEYNENGTLNYYSTCFTDDSRYVVFEGPSRWLSAWEVAAWEVATGKRVAVEDVHRQAFYRLKMRQPCPYTWAESGMEKNERQTLKQRPELVLRRADTYEPIAWLPIERSGKILYSPIAEVWGVHRGGHMYIYALERI